MNPTAVMSCSNCLRKRFKRQKWEICKLLAGCSSMSNKSERYRCRLIFEGCRVISAEEVGEVFNIPTAIYVTSLVSQTTNYVVIAMLVGETKCISLSCVHGSTYLRHGRQKRTLFDVQSAHQRFYHSQRYATRKQTC